MNLLFLFPLTVPTPNLDINLSRQNNYLTGSELTITCDITIDPNVNTPFIVNTVWTMLGEDSSGIGMQITDPEILKDASGRGQSRISLIDPAKIDFNTYRSQVQFSTLRGSMDSGSYTCTVDVIPIAGYNYVNAASTTDITTNLQFLPSVEILIPLADEIFTLTCNATTPNNLEGLGMIKVIWLYNGSETIRNNVTLTYNGDNSATLTFFPISQDQEGLYTCIATISIPGIPLQRNTIKDYTFSTLGKILYK